MMIFLGGGIQKFVSSYTSLKKTKNSKYGLLIFQSLNKKRNYNFRKQNKYKIVKISKKRGKFL